MISLINDISVFWSLSRSDQQQAIMLVSERLESEFTFLSSSNYCRERPLQIASYMHKESGVEMNLIPGGRFNFGFSEEEELQAFKISAHLPFDPASMRPVQSRLVGPFLIGKYPILEEFALNHVNVDEMVFRPDFGGPAESVPIYLTRSELQILLRKFGLDIATEVEWEYAARGGSEGLFYFGSDLPSYDILENEVCLTNFDDVKQNSLASNNFGLFGLMVGEWCKDHFRENYDMPVETIDQPPFAVRAGASILFPWQTDDEWALCITATRYSSELLEDGTCGARFIKRLEF